MNPKDLKDLRFGQGCSKCNDKDDCPNAFTEVSHYCCMYGYDPDREVKRYLLEAIRNLKEYCDGKQLCGSCFFDKCERDTCKIYDLIKDERYQEALK